MQCTYQITHKAVAAPQHVNDISIFTCIRLLLFFFLFSPQIFGFVNLASLEFYLHLGRSEMQNYMSSIVVAAEAAAAAANNEGNESNRVDSSQVNDCDIILKLASCTILYFVLYIAQRLANFLIYERFVDNCMEQFIDVTSIANISVLILINSYGYYIHGRSGKLEKLLCYIYFCCLLLLFLIRETHGDSREKPDCDSTRARGCTAKSKTPRSTPSYNFHITQCF